MMKKLLFTGAMLCAFVAKAQLVPNGDFTTTSGATGWASLGGTVTLTNSLNVTINGTPQTLRGIDNGYFAFAQNTTQVAGIATARFAFAARPVSLRFMTCYFPAAAGETMGIIVYLSKWNSGTGKRDTILHNIFNVAPTGPIYPWAEVTCNMTNYRNSDNPDSATVIFINTVNAGARQGTAATYDNVKFSDFAASVHDKDNHFSGSVQVTPNPIVSGTAASVNYTLNQASEVKIAVYDMTGRLVSEVFSGQELNGEHSHQLPSNLAKGQYTLQVSTGQYIQSQIIIVQ